MAATDLMIQDGSNKLLAWMAEEQNQYTLASLGDTPEVLNMQITDVMRSGIPEEDRVLSEEPRSLLLGSPIALWPFLVHRPYTGADYLQANYAFLFEDDAVTTFIRLPQLIGAAEQETPTE